MGTELYDPNGQEFVFPGWTVSGKGWPWTRPTVPDADLIVNC